GPRMVAATNCSKGLLAHVAVSQTGRFLAAGAPEEGFVNVWGLDREPANVNPRLVLHCRCGGNGPSAFLPNETTLAVRNYGFSLGLWDLASGALREKRNPKPADYATTVVFSPDGQWVATSAGGGRVVLWSVGASGGESRVLEANAPVCALKFSANGETLF